jgi:hypothetical protein
VQQPAEVVPAPTIETAQPNPPTKQKVRAGAVAQPGGKRPRTADTRSASGQDGALGEKDGALGEKDGALDDAAASAAPDGFRPGTKTVHQTMFSTLYLL